MTTWITLRAAGVGAYLMPFLSVGWGLIATTALISKRMAKATSVLIHQVLGTVGLALLAVHLGGTLVDEFIGFDWADLFVPMRSEYRPIAIAVGIVGMYAMVLVLISSWVRKGLRASWWRRVHLLATPAFGLSMVHGLAAGTDSTRPWMWWTYVGTSLVIVFLLMVRALTSGTRPARAPMPPGRAVKARAPGVAAPDAGAPERTEPTVETAAAP